MAVKLNLGCGFDTKEGYINVDKYNPKAEVQADLLALPFEDDSADEVAAFHVIEHISWRRQMDLYEEFHRVLKPGGLLCLAYPEFEECLRAFLENRNGQRWKWWMQVIYGHQQTEGQAHLAPIVTSHLVEQLAQVGFKDFDYFQDKCDSVLKCTKTNPQPWL